jgi:predicted HicB family RNase H-like nuclease
MARPKVYDERRVTTAIRLPESLHDRLRAEADARQVSVNYLVTHALADYLARLVPAHDAVRVSRTMPA